MFGSKINPSGAANDLGDDPGQSAMFDRASSSKTSRTFGTADSQKTFTISAWVRRTKFGIDANIFSTSNAGQTNRALLRFDSADTLTFYGDIAAGYLLTTTQVFRDVGWYHIAAVGDTSNGTSGDRLRLYVNGTRVTSFTSESQPTLNADLKFGQSELHAVGVLAVNNSQYFDGLICDFHYLDGIAVSDATSFGRFSTSHPTEWVPIIYAGSYGTEGCHLTFADNTHFGDDTSGNGLDFTDSGLGTDHQRPDTPYNVFNAFSGINISSLTTLSEGALKAVGSGSEVSGVWSNMPITSGQVIYLEGTWGSTSAWGYFGVSSKTNQDYVTTTFNSDASTHIFQLTPTASNRGVASAGSTLFTGKTAWTTTDTYQIAIDVDNGKLWFGVNDSWYDSGGTTTGDPAAGTNATVTFTAGTPMFVVAQSGGASSIHANFGQNSTNVLTGNADGNGYGDFEYAPPSGFLSYCSANLPNVVTDLGGVDLPGEHFNTILWQGNATIRSITGVGLRPDLLWIKDRDNTANFSNSITDAVRGVTKHIYTDSTRAELTSTGSQDITSFDSDGFSLAAANTNILHNASGVDYVGWNWLMGGAGAANSDGTISSTVSVSPTGAWSIGTFTGTGAAGTVGHGLPGAAEWYAVRNLTDVANWLVGHVDIGGTQFLELSQTSAAITNADKFSAYASSTVLNLGLNNEANGSGDSMFFMAFRSVPGLCKVGSYTGNGSTDGPYVDCGFSPTWVLTKPSSAANPWTITDRARDPYNPTKRRLHPNSNAAESADSLTAGDMLSSGFKLRASHGNVNQSSINYIFLAIAESAIGGGIPFPNAR